MIMAQLGPVVKSHFSALRSRRFSQPGARLLFYLGSPRQCGLRYLVPVAANHLLLFLAPRDKLVPQLVNLSTGSSVSLGSHPSARVPPLLPGPAPLLGSHPSARVPPLRPGPLPPPRRTSARGAPWRRQYLHQARRGSRRYADENMMRWALVLGDGEGRGGKSSLVLGDVMTHEMWSARDDTAMITGCGGVDFWR